jgi:hypothetical protein
MGRSDRTFKLLAMGLGLVVAVTACSGEASTAPTGGGPSGVVASQAGGPTSSPGASLASPALSSSPSVAASDAVASPSPSSVASSTTPAPKTAAPKPTFAVRPRLGTLPPPPPPPPSYYANLILYRTPIKGAANGQYWLIKADGTGNRKLALGSYAHWNSNGSAIEVVTYDTHCVPSLSVFPVGGGAATKISVPFGPGDGSFGWTPDGSRISFLRPTGIYNCGGASALVGRELFTVKSDGTGWADLANLPAPVPMAWVPDGSAVVIVRTAPLSGTGPIERIDVATKKVTQILAAATYSSVDVSPDGKYLAYIKYVGSQWRAHVIDSVGTGPVYLRHRDQDFGRADSQDQFTVWGADSKHLAVARDQPDPQLGSGTYGEYYWYDATRTDNGWGVFAGCLMTSTAPGNLDWSPDNTLMAVSTIGNFGTGKAPIGRILVGDTTGKSGIYLYGTEGDNWLAWQPWP